MRARSGIGRPLHACRRQLTAPSAVSGERGGAGSFGPCRAGLGDAVALSTAFSIPPGDSALLDIAAGATVCAAQPDLAAWGCLERLSASSARLAQAEALIERLRASEDSYRRMLAATGDFVVLIDGDGRCAMANERAVALFAGRGLVGTPWSRLWPEPEGREAAEAALTAALSGRAARFEACLPNRGAATWWEIATAPVPGRPGEPGQVVATGRDITERKAEDARRDLLMEELSHRIKNTLALVQGVATQTLRNAASIEEAGEALTSRLVALAKAHDVLMQGSWACADLRGLVEGAIALHGDGEPDRFRLGGPALTLGPRPALTLALMLHELATNATKYGALSSPAGHVAVSWSVAPVDGVETLHFRWEEIDGPPVSPPQRIGFGSRLIERSLVHSFGGSVRLTYPVTGAVLDLVAPLVADPP